MDLPWFDDWSSNTWLNKFPKLPGSQASWDFAGPFSARCAYAPAQHGSLSRRTWNWTAFDKGLFFHERSLGFVGYGLLSAIIVDFWDSSRVQMPISWKIVAKHRFLWGTTPESQEAAPVTAAKRKREVEEPLNCKYGEMVSLKVFWVRKQLAEAHDVPWFMNHLKYLQFTNLSDFPWSLLSDRWESVCQLGRPPKGKPEKAKVGILGGL